MEFTDINQEKGMVPHHGGQVNYGAEMAYRGDQPPPQYAPNYNQPQGPNYNQPQGPNYNQPQGPIGIPPNTTVIIQQPTMIGPPTMMPQNVREWQSGLCSCFDDCGTCVCGWLCGWCLWCKIAGRLNENPCVLCCVPGAAINLRTKMRTMYGIKGSMCKDCLEVECCGACTVCQMERELIAMGMA